MNIIPTKLFEDIEVRVSGLIEEALTSLAYRGRPSPHKRNTTGRVYLRSWIDFGLFLQVQRGMLPAMDWASREAHKDVIQAENGLKFLVQVINQVTRNDVETYRAALLNFPTRTKGRRQVGLSASTINRHLAAISFLFDVAIRKEMCESNPTHLVKRRKGRRIKKEPLTVGQIQRLLAAIDTSSLAGKRNEMLIKFLALTGARRDEACSLRIEDLEFSDFGLTITLLRKGGEKQAILASRELEYELTEYIRETKPTGPVFPLVTEYRDAYSTVPMAANRVTKIMHTLSDKVLQRKVGPHALRHAFITQALNNGAPLQVVQEYVGHSDPGTTVAYYHSSLTRESSAAEFVNLKEKENG